MSGLRIAIVCLMAACGVTHFNGANNPQPAAPPAVQGTTSNCTAEAQAPSAAAAAGFTKLAFCDDFDSISTIDADTTGAPGYKWYTRQPFGRGRTPQSDYSVADSVLTITDDNGVNFGITTMDTQTGNGSAWNFGYFEARISSDLKTAPEMANGWPSFWSNSAYHLLRETPQTGGTFAELDFFENPRNDVNGFAGTINEWDKANSIHYRNANVLAHVSVDWRQWHTVGVLWVRGRVTWYLDGKQILDQRYSPNGRPRPSAVEQHLYPVPSGTLSPLDDEKMGMQIILGSGKGWPMYVDWVRVWR
jgi:beta-glucanase (GH16 family)